ncbi:hypothetical protein CPB83DRAFT_774718 [Crepidotus variabilis]|uniref:Uncharacterized protein n=1 Tax=Crepidotus variabilis TaxID=179855 RepID=A0A9P6JKK1_9AGAR|nr:hypothetical protein CPB83DRAFT_774718 [Crepidotus variabilis]
MAPSSPPTGHYIVKSVSAKKFIGRSPHEDRSLLPKRVMVLPEDIQAPLLVFNNSGKETQISTGGAPTAVIDGKLFSILLEVPPGEKWTVEAVPQSGPNRYIVVTQDKSAGWVLNDNEPETQITVRPLVIGPSDPPFYPDNQVWEIVPAVNY